LKIANLEMSEKNFDEDHNAAHLKIIARCFSANNIEEIISRLENEAKISSFAVETLDKLRSRNPLALKLSLELLIRGRESTWMQAL
jgi:3-hydroxyisobutyryl-CoA hydrolase